MTVDTLRKVGKYEIRGTLGKGAMGIVYDGFDPVIERRVAIKTVLKESMDPGEAAPLIRRFKREARAAGRLNHPGIVSIHDYGEDDRVAFIAMEFIKGNELRKYFATKQRFALASVVRVMCDILDALDHAHRNGVVHRDIKPSNIMITEEGRVKVADFGVARIESSTMTQVGMRIGTPAYMSPEQHQGLPVSGRSDLFSAGVVLYEFLTGERPFAGAGPSLIREILLSEPLPPSRINPDIAPALDEVVLKALAKRPEDRFATAREFGEALRKAAMGESAGMAAARPVLSHEALPLDVRDALPRPGPASGATGAGTNASGDGDPNLASVYLEAELEYWKEIKHSTEPADFEAFLQAFPASRFAPLAQRRMNRLQAEALPQNDVSAVDGSGDQLKGSPGSPIPPGPEAEERAKHEGVPILGVEHDRPALEAKAARGTDGQGRQEPGGWSRLDIEPDVGDRTGEDAGSERERKRLEGEAQARGLRGEDRWGLDSGGPALVEMAPHDPGPVDHRRIKSVVGPVHARRRAAKPAHAQGEFDRWRPFDPSASRKPSRAPWAWTLAAVLLAAGGIWYAAGPSVATTIARLETETRTVWAQLSSDPAAEQQRKALEAQQAEAQRKRDEAARLAEERRRAEERLEAERERQLELVRQKEEAARAAATEKYQRAIGLLAQRRSSEAVRLLRELAKSGHGAAAKTLGDLYSSGEHVLRDMGEAAYFYAMAERNGFKFDGPALVHH